MKTQSILIILSLVCVRLLQTTQAVAPAPDGGYPGGNTAEGQAALLSLTTGGYNTAVGFFSLSSNTAGAFNTAIGAGTLLANTGGNNTATGAGALLSNSSGSNDTANGMFALLSNTTGNNNTATGQGALQNNTTALFNTANGALALQSNTTGGNNTATGAGALQLNTTGPNNTANGTGALYPNTDGHDNTGVGFEALHANESGFSNNAFGSQALHADVGNSNGSGARNNAFGTNALFNNTTGFENCAFGDSALFNNTDAYANTAIGYFALYACVSGIANTAIGDGAGLNITGNGNVCIGLGAWGAAGVNSTTWIANVYDSVASARVVYVNSDNQIGTLASSRRFKEDIRPMEKASQAILALNPVTFRYKKQFDASRTPMFGLVAEDVEKVDPSLVTRNAKDEAETVRYDAINVMLLNEFLKEHRKVEEQQATITQLKKDFAATVAQLTARLDEQACQIQKVSAQLEASKPTPQVVNNP
jgi:hypothetical protein